MDKTTKQTAMFFGFLASAMTCAAVPPAQAANPAQGAPAIERQAPDLVRAAERARPNAVRAAKRTAAPERGERS